MLAQPGEWPLTTCRKDLTVKLRHICSTAEQLSEDKGLIQQDHWGRSCAKNGARGILEKRRMFPGACDR